MPEVPWLYRSDIRNEESIPYVPIIGADRKGVTNHHLCMIRDWFIKEWMAHSNKRQADLVKELGWQRRKASEVFNGDQPYKRETVNEISEWLGIEPYELLMLPEDAVQLRQFRAAALAIAAGQGKTAT